MREPNPNSDEAVSTPSAPAEQPAVATVVDPRPPATPVITPDLRWTALPDTTGRARGVLRWPPSSRATGYAVWQATESAIRLAVDAGQPEPPPGTSLMERAAALQALLNRDEAARRDCLRAFARLNTELVTATELEIELPGAANTLYAYRISAVGANNEMSERSGGAILFGVPRRNVPGRPGLMLRKGPAGVFAICLESPGAAVAGFQLFRVREASLLIDAGAAGEPYFGAAHTGWRSLDALPSDPLWDVVRQVVATLPAGTRGRAILDSPPVSWRPYWYAAVALGTEDLAAGEYGGESARSAAQQVVLTPPGPPVLTPPTLSARPDSRVLQFDAGLPMRRTDLGAARIAIYRLDTAGARARRELLIETRADEVPQGDLPAGPFAGAAIRRGPPGTGGLTRYSALLPVAATTGAIVVTDPLGRAIERTFTEAPA